jgi:hypothetical protein
VEILGFARSMIYKWWVFHCLNGYRRVYTATLMERINEKSLDLALPFSSKN